MFIFGFVREDVIIVDAEKLVPAVNYEGNSCPWNYRDKKNPVDVFFKAQEEIAETDKPWDDDVLLEVSDRYASAVAIEQKVIKEPEALERDEEETNERFSDSQTHQDCLSIDIEVKRGFSEGVEVF